MVEEEVRMQPVNPSPAVRIRRLASHALSAALLTVGLASPLVAQGGWPAASEVREILLEPEAHGASTKLAKLGHQVAPTLWAVMAGRAYAEDGLNVRASQDLMRQAVVSWTPDEVVRSLAGALKGEVPLGERLVAVKLLAWTDSQEGLEAVLGVYGELRPLELRSHQVRGSLDRALESLVGSNTTRLRWLADEVSDLPPDLLPLLVEATGALQNSAALQVLVQLAETNEELERQVLGEVAKRDLILSSHSRDELIELARKNLNHTEAALRRLAIVSLGKLRAVESFRELTMALEDEDRVVRRVALQTLQELSTIERSWDREQWLGWYDSELNWGADSSDLANDLLGDDLYLAKRAAKELADHAIIPEVVAERLSRGIHHEDSGIRKLVCQGLADLSHPSAVPVLIEALVDQDGEVRLAARRALEGLTQLELGEDSAAWNEWWYSF